MRTSAHRAVGVLLMSDTCPVLQLESLVLRALESKRRKISISGTGESTTLAALLSGNSTLLSHSAHLIVVPDVAAAEDLITDLLFFSPNTKSFVLPSFDVSPYSGLYPNVRTIAGRMRWYHKAKTAGPNDIFIAPVEALIQKCIPPKILAESYLPLKPGLEISNRFSDQLVSWGYYPVSLVEDTGSFAVRGGTIDIFSPSYDKPIRLELFGNTIDSLRFFEPKTQRTLESISFAEIIPTREIIFSESSTMSAAKKFREACDDRGLPRSKYDAILKLIARDQPFNGIDFLLPYYYENLSLPIDHLPKDSFFWVVDPIEVQSVFDETLARIKSESQASSKDIICPNYKELYFCDPLSQYASQLTNIELARIAITKNFESPDEIANFEYSSQSFTPPKKFNEDKNISSSLQNLLSDWRARGYHIFFSAVGDFKIKRLLGHFSETNFKIQKVDDGQSDWRRWAIEQEADSSLIHLVSRDISRSFHFPDEKILILSDSIFSGFRKHRSTEQGFSENFEKFNTLSFADLKTGDFIVHVEHGIGYFDGLQKLSINGIDSEFIALKYKDNDKLYLPVYRINQIQKYSGPASDHLVDKLGSGNWAANKVKVQSKLRDVASELLELYAARDKIHRIPYSAPNNEYFKFENEFPYEETPDQIKAVNDILNDYQKDRPMDRLICGDVGFGKTEVAMRAAFKVLQEKRTVVVLAPTTVLTFQHYENFKKRFIHWPTEIRLLNRFVSKSETDKTIAEMQSGKIDIIIGTHRILSKDVIIKNMGLLIIDEEHKFGVMHKEKIRKISTEVDTLALSATPIPRTLNMSLVGIRDISIINTAPVDRLPIRTFICKFDPETIRKAISTELARGGQAFFVHNRVQSIYSLYDELKNLLPDVKITVAHGQMETKELEDAVISFYKGETQVLLCTTIIESGIDMPNANTMFIDRADTFGLSQLYQLRGRIGRSTKRAYCYLLVPETGQLDKQAQERLKVIQENSALGSGFRIAHHDLELRGAGNILGEDQSGHIAAVGFELYYELLEEALKSVRGDEQPELIPDPEINVRIPALIPDSYIPDIRLRLAYYKMLSQIRSQEDISRYADEMRDQFGHVPEETNNLMGLMLVRSHCQELRVRDLSSGTKNISLAFTDKTPLPAEAIIKLTAQSNKKYSFSKDGRLLIRMNEISLPNIFSELDFLLRLCP